MALVAPSRLPQGVVRAGHVEDVVDDLEQDAQLRREVAELRQSRPFARTLHEEQYALHGRADQAAGLELVQAAQARGALRDESPDVDVLAPDHAVDAGGGGELADGLEEVGGLAGLLGEDELERLGVEAVAGEDGD